MRGSMVISLAICCAGASSVSAAAAREPRTVAGVLTADDEWLADEKRGDVAALDRRLADAYRDIDPDGTVHPKSELLGWTSSRKDKAVGTVAEIAAEFRRRNPAVMEVVLTGETAVVSFHSTDPARRALVMSVDVFTYERGMWRGLLSKHSSQPVLPAAG